jgi:integrase
MLLSFYTRARSPWVWVQWAAGPGRKRVCERTALRKDDPDLARRKELLRLEWQRKLLLADDRGAVPAADVDGSGGGVGSAEGADVEVGHQTAPDVEARKNTRQGWAWVVQYLGTRYRAKTVTRGIYEIHWQWLWEFLAGQDIRTPAELRREHCFAYVQWRTTQVKKKSGRSPKLNTALGELKLLGNIMNEAVARGLAVENPAKGLRIEREDSDPKPDISDAEAARIYGALALEPVWMQRSFFVAFNTGLRFASTRFHRSQVRWEEGRIIIEKPKGGRKREFSIEIYPIIAPMLREWWESGEPWLWTHPTEGGHPMGIHWTRFFRKIGLPHLCFHCTRVAFITRGAMRAVPESAMRQMTNHASSEIHRIYQRWQPSRFREFAAQLAANVTTPAFAGGPSLGSAKPLQPTPEKRGLTRSVRGRGKSGA